MPEPAPGSTSIAAALAEAVGRLGDAGLENPRREATTLWAAVSGAGLKPGDVWLRREQEPPTEVAERFRQAVAQRVRGIPFAYAVGRVGFRTLELNVDRRALIPRPETEGLVDLVLHAVRSTQETTEPGSWGTAADIGTGCGCLALSLALEGEFARVIAVERSAAAAALARENIALVRPSRAVEVREGDLLAPLAGERCRAIVSNPPYLTDAEYLTLDPTVRGFEPRAALASGPDGLDASRALIGGAAALLAPGGVLALEVDERRAERAAALARAHGWARVAIHEDLFGRPRFLLAYAKEEA